MPAKRTLRFVIAIIALTGVSTTLLAVRAAAPKPNPANAPQQQIARSLKRHESLKLDSVATERQVRRSGRLLLATPSQSFDLELTPHDLRAADYRAEEVVEGGGVRSVGMDTVPTFRGTVRGQSGAEARFTIDKERIEGVIITADERYYVEPLRNFTDLSVSQGAQQGSSAVGPATDYVLYKGSDVIEGAHGACATSMAGKLNAALVRLAPRANQALQATANTRQADLATEADYEYVSYFGNSAAANTEILSIMNQVDGLYQQEMGVTFRVTYQHTWATSADPYSTTAADGILTEFTNYWNANINQPRDLAHLWTGRQIDGGATAGIAWLGTICQRSATYSYGVSLRLTSGLKSSITAHEIGHNFGATHPDQEAPPVTACATTVMNSTVGQNFDFCQFSLGQMTTYLTTNSGCLATVATATIQFSAADYPVSENAGSVVVTVTRAGDTSGAANVDYATSNGTASDRSDYVAASGRLSFAAGEASKTFPIFIVDDAYVEGNQTINLSLSNPSGATLGGQSSATVTINDNDFVTPVTNPLDGAQFFVRQHYLDFLNREADSGGLSYWTSTLTSCGGAPACLSAGHTSVSAAFFVESEFQETGYYVYRIYQAGLGRKPVFDEFAADRGRVVGNPDLNASKQALAADFVTRPVFVAQYPAGITPELYVDQLNANTGTSLTQVQRDALVNGMKNGTEGRATVLQQIAENQLFKQREYNSAFVLMQYFGYLRRGPDQAGYDFWLGVLSRQPNSFRGMVCSFLTSAEYQLRFSPVVPRSNGECSQ
jgi:hypothetical protein